MLVLLGPSHVCTTSQYHLAKTIVQLGRIDRADGELNPCIDVVYFVLQSRETLRVPIPMMHLS